MKRYHHVEFADVPPTDCSCGTTRRAFMDVENAPASAHYLELGEEPISHYHKKTTEIYIILEGEGHIELDGEMVAVKPMSAIMIHPECRHRAVGKLKLLNIPIPKHDPDDISWDREALKEGQVPVH